MQTYITSLTGGLQVPPAVGEAAVRLSEEEECAGVAFAYSEGVLTICGLGRLDYFAAGEVLRRSLERAEDDTVHELSLAFSKGGRITSLGTLRVSREEVRRETVADLLMAMLATPTFDDEADWNEPENKP